MVSARALAACLQPKCLPLLLQAHQQQCWPRAAGGSRPARRRLRQHPCSSGGSGPASSGSSRRCRQRPQPPWRQPLSHRLPSRAARWAALRRLGLVSKGKSSRHCSEPPDSPDKTHCHSPAGGARAAGGPGRDSGCAGARQGRHEPGAAGALLGAQADGLVLLHLRHCCCKLLQTAITASAAAKGLQLQHLHCLLATTLICPIRLPQFIPACRPSLMRRWQCWRRMAAWQLLQIPRCWTAAGACCSPRAREPRRPFSAPSPQWTASRVSLTEA